MPLRRPDTPWRRLRSGDDARRAGRTPRRRSCTRARRLAAPGEPPRGRTGRGGRGSAPSGRTRPHNSGRGRCMRGARRHRLPRGLRPRTMCMLEDSSSMRRSLPRPRRLRAGRRRATPPTSRACQSHLFPSDRRSTRQSIRSHDASQARPARADKKRDFRLDPSIGRGSGRASRHRAAARRAL